MWGYFIGCGVGTFQYYLLKWVIYRMMNPNYHAKFQLMFAYIIKILVTFSILWFFASSFSIIVMLWTAAGMFTIPFFMAGVHSMMLYKK